MDLSKYPNLQLVPDATSKWIEFYERLDLKKPKTNVYEVRTKGVGDCIAFIRWYAPWRCYSFEPLPNTVFEKTCLTDIIQFIDKLMFKRKVELQNKKQNG